MLKCSAYKALSDNATNLTDAKNKLSDLQCIASKGTSNPAVYFKDSNYSSAADFKTAVTGQTLVYELATPQPYQLTAEQVAMLDGTNSIWADTGDTTLTYRANPYTALLARIAALEAVSLGLPADGDGFCYPVASVDDGEVTTDWVQDSGFIPPERPQINA